MRNPEHFFANRLGAAWANRRRFTVKSPEWHDWVSEARSFARALRQLVPRGAGQPLADRIAMIRRGRSRPSATGK
jgi:hypothetical protein